MSHDAARAKLPRALAHMSQRPSSLGGEDFRRGIGGHRPDTLGHDFLDGLGFETPPDKHSEPLAGATFAQQRILSKWSGY